MNQQFLLILSGVGSFKKRVSIRTRCVTFRDKTLCCRCSKIPCERSGSLINLAISLRGPTVAQ